MDSGYPEYSSVLGRQASSKRMRDNDAPFFRLLCRLIAIPLALFVVHLDIESEGTIGRWVLDVAIFVVTTFFWLIALISAVIGGVAATGRLKSRPDSRQKKASFLPEISGRIFLAAMTYMALFGWLYFSKVPIAGVSLIEFSGLTNALLFVIPPWTIICIIRFRTETRRRH